MLSPTLVIATLGTIIGFELTNKSESLRHNFYGSLIGGLAGTLVGELFFAQKRTQQPATSYAQVHR